MLRIYIFLIFFLNVISIYSQTDTISSRNVKKVYDTIKGQYSYYEKIDLNDKDFTNNKNYKLILDKIIKSKNKIEVIKDGKLIKEFFFKDEEYYIIINFFEKDNFISEYRVYCQKNEIIKIEEYSNEKILKAYFFGLNKRQYVYEYHDWGYFLIDKFNGMINTYKITQNFKGKEIERVLFTSETINNVENDSEGFFYNDFKEFDFIKEKLNINCDICKLR
ncbi:MAG TPA: hypothetical protein VK164_02530 [Flavobacterium sp.]|uniref:hypothetical protein n=1 Tax=Flavobacterium sp. TaxID=239 RepID=UPI002B4AC2E2|nr:hypothetical protein [Flavobacterium sp.]HLO72789.1 hypothetical protein [Flavobacterium sp.]